MKLRSQAKHKDVVLRVTTNEKIAALLEQYVVYANTQLGHSFADVKELSAEVLRAFVEEDRGFKTWRETGSKKQAAAMLPLTKGAVKQNVELVFENGQGAK